MEDEIPPSRNWGVKWLMLSIQSTSNKLLLEKKMATYPRILAWRIPWTEEPGGLQSMWSQRVRHD